MRTGFHRQLNLPSVEIFAGEYHVTTDTNVVISTLLGSCVSVCLKDIRTGMAGMNHFMLPKAVKEGEIIISEAARYGTYAMELMINEMLKLGARRSNLHAKVFGGGHILDTMLNTVSDSNIHFAFSFLKLEGIPVLGKDVGGSSGRRVLFLPGEFSVYVRKIGKTKQLNTAISQEKRYLQMLHQKQKATSDVELFD